MIERAPRGDLIFRRQAAGAPGVIYCRLIPRSSTELAESLLILLRTKLVTFEGKFSVVERDHVRQRTLPARAKG